MRSSKKHIIIVLIVLLLNMWKGYAQEDVPAVSTGGIQFYLDHTSFMGKEGKQFVEFYLMVFADQVQTDNNNAEFSVSTAMTDAYNKDISRKDWTTHAQVNNDSLSPGKVIYDQWNEYLIPGMYNLEVTITDKLSGKKGSADYSIKINEPVIDKLSISELQFASKIETGKSTGQFSKGDKTVIPNPSRRYGILNPVLYLYYEFYNPSGKLDKLDINYAVIDRTGKTAKKFPAVQASHIALSATFSHGLNVANIPSGIYDMEVKITDSAAGKSVTKSRRFEVIQKDYAELQPSLTTDDSKTFEKLLNIIGSENEIKIFNQLQLAAKAEFIVQYWKNQDPTPGTPENEFLQKVQERFAYANNNFTWGENKGWETERGRVLIKYGMPDDMERHYSEASTVPYEIWHYTREKSFYFVFGDLRSNGRFVLLHSNLEGEISNDNWQEYIRRM